jgi:hypothetical protein
MSLGLYHVANRAKKPKTDHDVASIVVAAHHHSAQASTNFHERYSRETAGSISWRKSHMYLKKARKFRLPDNRRLRIGLGHTETFDDPAIFMNRFLGLAFAAAVLTAPLTNAIAADMAVKAPPMPVGGR